MNNVLKNEMKLLREQKERAYRIIDEQLDIIDRVDRDLASIITEAENIFYPFGEIDDKVKN